VAQIIGAFEAKTSFARLVDKAEHGADFTITANEKPMVNILPFEKKPEMTRQEAIAKLMEMRKLYRGKPGSFNLRKAIEDGRR
jgi:antitoxin (DNA-binding transcriptional repressor) of toxin-antitoxin stability system